MDDVKILIPRPFAAGIDDMGWINGTNESHKSYPGPYRAGVKRIFDVSDYKAVVDVGKALGVRIQGLFVLGELDRDNVLDKYPDLYPSNIRWKCSSRADKRRLDEIMDFLKKESAYLEFGFHGIGHEYWEENGTRKRAEWYNLIDRKPWPEESMYRRIAAAREILAQYGLSPDYGHSFPESFVPCAYSYFWNPNGEYSLGKILSEAGVRFAATDFSQIPELDPPLEINGGAFDHGVHVVSRQNYGNCWYELDSLPRVLPELQTTDMIETHWPNWLAQDDFMQASVTQRWIQYFQMMERQDDRYLAKNTEQFHSQWLYRKYTVLRKEGNNVVEIDNSAMPDEAYLCGLSGTLVLKIPRKPHEHLSYAALNGEPIMVFQEHEDFLLLYLPPLKKKRYLLQYELDLERMPFYIHHKGTSNIYNVLSRDDFREISLKVYGKECISVSGKPPKEVFSDNVNLKVLNHAYDSIMGMFDIEVEATNFQGTAGNLILHY